MYGLTSIAVPLLLVMGTHGREPDHNRPSAAFAFAHLSHRPTDNHRALLPTQSTIPPELL